MLRFPSEEGIYPGLQQVKDLCTVASLAAFAWDLFSAWQTAGAPSKESWAFTALGIFGNDDTARAVEELEDRLAPDLGLNADGTLTLDFGPRRFIISFDEALRPYVRDENGSRLKDLPKPNKSDDKALATEAVNRYKALKKDARTIAAQQIARMESAMCPLDGGKLPAVSG